MRRQSARPAALALGLVLLLGFLVYYPVAPLLKEAAPVSSVQQIILKHGAPDAAPASDLAAVPQLQWAEKSANRWWHNSSEEMWRWSFPLLNESSTQLDAYPCQLGLDVATQSCSESNYCTSACRFEDALFLPPQPTMCQNRRRVPMFEFKPKRAPFTLADVALRFGKPLVRIAMMGDSIQNGLYFSALCHLAKIPEVTILGRHAMRAMMNITTSNAFVVPWFHVAVAEIKVPGREPPVRLVLEYFGQNQPSARPGLLEQTCARADLFMFDWGLHYPEPGLENWTAPHQGYVKDMTSALTRLKSCHEANGTLLSYLSHVTPHFSRSRMGWFTTNQIREIHLQLDECKPIEGTMEQADFRSTYLRNFVLPAVGMHLLPPLWGPNVFASPAPVSSSVHLLPWFDLTFFADGKRGAFGWAARWLTPAQTTTQSASGEASPW
jgi:hypothetical protein